MAVLLTIESSLCDDGDLRNRILIDFWDYDWDKSNDFMGYIIISVYELFEKCARKEGIPLLPGKPGHKWGGHLHVDHIELVPKTSRYHQV